MKFMHPQIATIAKAQREYTARLDALDFFADDYDDQVKALQKEFQSTFAYANNLKTTYGKTFDTVLAIYDKAISENDGSFDDVGVDYGFKSQWAESYD